MAEQLDTIVIGAGQAGLAASYFLCEFSLTGSVFAFRTVSWSIEICVRGAVGHPSSCPKGADRRSSGEVRGGDRGLSEGVISPL
jgi:hypothetical protein